MPLGESTKGQHLDFRKLARPFGLLAGLIPQIKHVWVEYASLISSNTTHGLMALYLSCVLNIVHAASCTDFAIGVLARALAFTLPTTITACSLTSRVVSLWIASLRWLAILDAVFRVLVLDAQFQCFDGFHAESMPEIKTRPLSAPARLTSG